MLGDIGVVICAYVLTRMIQNLTEGIVVKVATVITMILTTLSFIDILTKGLK